MLKKEVILMKKHILRFLALILVCCLLTGCGVSDPASKLASAILNSSNLDVTSFDQMVYTHPNLEKLEASLEKACDAAAKDDFRVLIRSIYEFYDLYDAFDTSYTLADIHYCTDLTDEYWEEEYNYCLSISSRVDAMLEELYCALAKSPCLEYLESDNYFGTGFFDSYQDQEPWDEAFTALLEQESALISRYYELTALGNAYEPGSEEYFEACYEEMAQILADLVPIRQQIAWYWGYEDFAQFAADNYYYRDYDLSQTEAYLREVQQQLTPLYTRFLANVEWGDAFAWVTETQTHDWLQNVAMNMGGTVADCYLVMDQGKLYDIGYSENKYPASFETYIVNYQVPYVFLAPYETEYDYLVFAHEFGHFCNDYVAYGSYAGMDVQEFFSQGMEYLALCYAEDAQQLIQVKMAESLAIYVEQSAYSAFEMALYRLPAEQITPETIRDLFARTAADYGIDYEGFDTRYFVAVNHFFTDPMYVLSYVVSNDAAMQLYQLEQETPGVGLARYQENLGKEEYYFLAFLQGAGLESPFAPGRLNEVANTFAEILS